MYIHLRMMFIWHCVDVLDHTHSLSLSIPLSFSLLPSLPPRPHLPLPFSFSLTYLPPPPPLSLSLSIYLFLSSSLSSPLSLSLPPPSLLPSFQVSLSAVTLGSQSKPPRLRWRDGFVLLSLWGSQGVCGSATGCRLLIKYHNQGIMQCVECVIYVHTHVHVYCYTQ